MESTHILTESDARLLVDNWGDSTIYINISQPMASTSAVLTNEEAKQLAHALLDLVEAA